ncbi:MAG TPA: hypothetical protein VHH13_07155, partial [Arthrobacter sp.]|nr:hypothetical protein [Arthrobacter sp.]
GSGRLLLRRCIPLPCFGDFLGSRRVRFFGQRGSCGRIPGQIFAGSRDAAAGAALTEEANAARAEEIAEARERDAATKQQAS